MNLALAVAVVEAGPRMPVEAESAQDPAVSAQQVRVSDPLLEAV